MKKSQYFIDCGGNDGCSVRKFRQHFGDADQFTIHSFEPNPSFRNCYDSFENVIFHEEAIWIEDGEMRFYLSKSNQEQGSTLIHSKSTGCLDRDNYLMVRCIDFSSWLLGNFTIDQYIVLKMDIEGAEYEVLKKMIQDNSIAYINQLYIEFHYEKIDMSKDEHAQLIEQLSQYDLPIHDWDALRF